MSQTCGQGIAKIEKTMREHYLGIIEAKNKLIEKQQKEISRLKKIIETIQQVEFE